VAGPATTKTFNPTTGKVEEIDSSSLGRAEEASGSHMLSAKELEAWQQQQADEARGNNLVESAIAGQVGTIRGLGESIGVPTDQIATQVGKVVGQEDTVKGYLNDLRKFHPLTSFVGENAGQMAGGVAIGELTGGGAPAKSIATRLGGGALRAGLENTVAGTTHDINETYLGNADAAGQKIFAQMPKHFLGGAAAGLIMGGAGEGLSAAGAAIQKHAPAWLDKQASAAVGREFGGGAALGHELRARVGGEIPTDPAALTSALRAEQKAFREGAQAEVATAKEALAGKQTTEAAKLSAEQEGRRIAKAKEAQAALEEIRTQHKTAREALDAQHGEAASSAVKLESELVEARTKMRNLADELDKVKGAELPSARNIIGEANAKFVPGDSLTPPSPRSQALFNEWAEAFEAKYAGGAVPFKDLQGVIKGIDVMERRQRVVSGWGDDPEVRQAFSAIRDAAKSEFDRASEATANAVSDAKGLSAAQLRESIPQLEKALQSANDNVDSLQAAIFKFDRQAATEVKLAEREAKGGAREFERGVREEDRAFDRASKAEEKGIPKASKETPVDTLLGKIKRKPEDEQVGNIGLGGALMSLLHGNVAGAAMSAIGGFAAQNVKAQGNLLAARTLKGLSEYIANADGAIFKMAGRAVGRYARSSATREDNAPKREAMTFDKVAKSVRQAQNNPLILEQRVRAVAGSLQVAAVDPAAHAGVSRGQAAGASRRPALAYAPSRARRPVRLREVRLHGVRPRVLRPDQVNA
jgi:hypothetical protein